MVPRNLRCPSPVSCSSRGRRSCLNPICLKQPRGGLLFTYLNGEFTPLSKPFKTKQLAEKARSKFPERERKTGVGVVRNQGLGAEEWEASQVNCRPRSRTLPIIASTRWC